MKDNLNVCIKINGFFLLSYVNYRTRKYRIEIGEKLYIEDDFKSNVKSIYRNWNLVILVTIQYIDLFNIINKQYLQS